MLAATSNAFVASQFLGNCRAAVPGNSGKATSVNKRQINKKLSPPRDISMATVDRQTEVASCLYVQGTRKKCVFFSKQDPGRVRQNS